MMLTSFVSRNSLLFFLVGLFFIKIPPLYLIPGISSQLLTTQVLSRLIFLGLFLYIIFFSKSSELNRFNKLIKCNSTEVNLIIIFFLVLSLGVVFADNTFEFMFRYKEVVFSLIIYLLGLYFGAEKKAIARIITISIVVSLVYQLVALVYTDFFVRFFGLIVNAKHFQLVKENIDRGRIYIESYDEAMLPIMLWYLVKVRSKGLLGYILAGVTGLFSLLSNFRSRIAMLLVSLVGIVGASENVRKLFTAKSFIIIAFSFVLFVFADRLSLELVGYSYIDRLTFSSKREDIDTVTFRKIQVESAIEKSKANYMLGVGLGNYYDGYSGIGMFGRFHYLNSISAKGSAEYVHNIFGTFLAEGGVLGFMVFLMLMIHFLRRDLNSKSKVKYPFILSFWSLFIYNMLNPFVPLSLQGLFWLLRGIIAYE